MTITTKQIKMLEGFVTLLDVMSQEAEDDSNFNECLARMRVWQCSLDEMSSIIKNHIDLVKEP